MKVLVVGPAAYYSTWDVFEGHVAGFRDNGCEVLTYDYGKRLRAFGEFAAWAKKHRRIEEDFGERVYAWCGESIYITAKVHKVDLVWLVAPQHIHPVPLALLKMDGIKTAGYMTECPYEDEVQAERAAMFDYCFLSDRNSLDYWRERNPQSFYLAHAYEPTRHYPAWADQKHDVIFIGTGFPARRKFLQAVDWEGINFGAYGHWRGLPKTAPIRAHLESRIVDNAETAGLYRASRIGLQLHRVDTYYQHGWRIKPGAAYSIGPRSYELAACGVFQVSDERPELHDVFNGSVPTFSTPLELGALLRRYLADPVARQELAQRQHEAIQPHSFANRIKEVLDIVT